MNTGPTRTCFVIIGYGDKIDLASQRRLNLDSVFENIIKPTFASFENPHFNCFRACDENFGGIIDVQMYKWILDADFVIADISTLNPNAIYELGIRHALRPFSTLVIAEDGIKEFPFDINHVKIEKYKHLGQDIGVSEAKRFINVLRIKIQQMLDNQACDSPVYTFIQNLRPPYFEAEGLKKSIKKKPLINANEKRQSASQKLKQEESLTELLKKASIAIRSRKFYEALGFYKEAEQRDKLNSYLKYQIILATYKSEYPNKNEALIEANELLKSYFDLSLTIDQRALELKATINKKLAELEYEKGAACVTAVAKKYAYTAVAAYEKAYVLSDSFFIGGNYANVLLIAAVLESNIKEKYHLFLRSNLMWQRVYNKTLKLISQDEMEKSKLYKKRNVFEKLVQSGMVLRSGIIDKKLEKIKADLQKIQTNYQNREFNERTEKSLKYANLIRDSLKKLNTNDMFL